MNLKGKLGSLRYCMFRVVFDQNRIDVIKHLISSPVCTTQLYTTTISFLEFGQKNRQSIHMWHTVVWHGRAGHHAYQTKFWCTLGKLVHEVAHET